MGVFVCAPLCSPVPKQITEVLGWGGHTVVKKASLATLVVAGDQL